MHQLQRFRSKRFGMMIACGLAWLGLGIGQAHAGPLTLIVTEGASIITIADNDPLFDTNLAVGTIAVDTSLGGALNSSLVNFQFNSLDAVSNAPGTSALASLIQNGSVLRLAGAGSSTITILATDNDYSLPTGPGFMNSTSSNTFLNGVAGNSETFKSWFNPSNLLEAKDIPSPILTHIATGINPDGFGANATPTPVTLSPPYGLTNETVITLSPGVINGWSNGTVVTAVPEPTGVVLMMTALPLLGWLRLRHRKP